MAKDKDSDDKSTAVKDAEKFGGQSFEPTPTPEDVEQSRLESIAHGDCPDCAGRGIRNPSIDHQVCQTCQGTGKA